MTELDVVESIANAVAVYKRIRSTSPDRKDRREYRYVIQSPNLAGSIVCTKGKLVRQEHEPSYYFLISSKRAD